MVNAYERDPRARQLCIARHGTTCVVCGFSFAAVYGPVADGFIHVHHLRPLSELGGEYEINPDEDLRPVCPNCHAVLHRRVPAFSIDEVRAFLDSKIMPNTIKASSA
jgi:predicted HNH restriction endonuclease